MTKPKAKNKNVCAKCFEKHPPPAGKKCQRGPAEHFTDNVINQKTVKKGTNKKMKQDSQLSSAALLYSSVSSDEITEQQDCFLKKASASATQCHSDHLKTKDLATSSEEEDHHSTDTQALILKELRWVNNRLDAVKDLMASSSRTSTHRKGTQVK